MAVQEVLQFGNPLLRKAAVEVTDVSAESARHLFPYLFNRRTCPHHSA